MSNNIEKQKIIKISELINLNNLIIPEYQRPYKWTIKNVNQLIDDIFLFKDNKSYRFGTIVLHKENKDKKEILNIVDGQQRTITLFLIILAIKNSEKAKDYLRKHTNSSLDIKSGFEFTNSISQYNIKQNYQEISRRIKDFDTHVINFILEKCEFVVITLNDISEAFQFFDSQNARGRDLEPHDLLKAFHLREMFDSSEEEKTKVVKVWENMDQSKLSDLFSNRLFRIRNWSKGNSARYFTKNEVDLFKGISINSKTKSVDPYAKVFQMANVFVDNYNKSSDRLVDFMPMDYPFQLDLPILNGKRFFEMISYYEVKYNEFLKENEIIKMLNEYDGRHRTGDKYIRMLFDCASIFYVDKFGMQEIEKVVEKIFVWAYKKRLEMQAVYLETIDNYALETNLFKIIRESNSYKDILNLYISDVQINPYNKNSNKLIKIIEKMKTLGFCNGY
ncbi:DUF262 domain-containing protein [Aliarcobacter butzleri]|uniref:DUF262 domain-containing protein n=1 Tax=Aliarcobacter butzleri TaxID=28197 RepID=UPI002B24438F|nr:DUF262 domain-containing protein [Aliarcobacter butzleri]